MDFTKYKNKLEYPQTPIKPSIKHHPSAEDALSYAEKKRKYDKAMEEYREKRNAYNEEEKK